MLEYQVHTDATAPRPAQATLREIKHKLGAVPNLAATMAEAPGLLKGFFALREIYYNEGTLAPAEIQVLSLTNAFENGCEYCMALHTTFARKEGVSEESIVALRAGRSPVEPRLRALSDFSRTLVHRRGDMPEDQFKDFLAAGFSPGQALEVVLGIAVSILPNFAHHLTGAPLDGVFQRDAWTRATSTTVEGLPRAS